MMGSFSVEVELSGPAGSEVVTMLVDSGAVFCAVPQALADRLGLQPVMQRPVRLADGTRRMFPVASMRVAVAGETADTYAFILGNGGRPLLGAVALESLFLGIDPVRQRLVPVEGFLGVVSS
jgi:clan AA aspartic protease